MNCEEILAKFADETEAFRKWDHSLSWPRYGEWECDYERWGNLNAAAECVLALDTTNWRPETTLQMLYVIARDNEIEVIADWVSRLPAILRHLAEAAIAHGERDVKWQIAKQLGRCEEFPGRESLLLDLVADEYEYVRRMALRALADIGSSHVERMVDAAWSNDEEYQRIMCLYALYRVRSPRAHQFIALAKADSRKHFVNYAKRLEAEGIPEIEGR